MTHFTLVVGHNFSLANETDKDYNTDYFPGMWGLTTKKSAMKYSKQILADGDKITVDDYNDPNYHKIANEFIKELGLSQPLFEEPSELVSTVTDPSVPSNLSQLKKMLQPDTKISINSFGVSPARNTFVKKAQSGAVILDKNGSNSWLYFEKASDWTFDNKGATQHDLSRDGKYRPIIRLTYIDQTDKPIEKEKFKSQINK